MANVNVKFNGKDYLLSCDDGQEESLKKLTLFLDKKYNQLKDKNLGRGYTEWYKMQPNSMIAIVRKTFDTLYRKDKILRRKLRGKK